MGQSYGRPYENQEQTKTGNSIGKSLQLFYIIYFSNNIINETRFVQIIVTTTYTSLHIGCGSRNSVRGNLTSIYKIKYWIVVKCNNKWIIIFISDGVQERIFFSSDEEKEDYEYDYNEDEESSGNIITYLVGDFVQGIANFKGGVISGVFRAKANVVNGILNAKGNVINGIHNGIVNGWEHAVNDVNSLENWINVKCILCFLIDKYTHIMLLCEKQLLWMQIMQYATLGQTRLIIGTYINI